MIESVVADVKKQRAAFNMESVATYNATLERNEEETLP